MPPSVQAMSRWTTRNRGRLLRTVVRLVLAGVWLWAAAAKLPHPESSVTAVRAYQILPGNLADTVGHALPIVEAMVGILLLIGFLTRPAAVVSLLLYAAFVIGVASVWIRGISIDCGCFGGGGADPNAIHEYRWIVARDVALAALSLWLVLRPRTRAALDDVVFPTSERFEP